MATQLRTLSDFQAATFDHDYVTDAGFRHIAEQIRSSFSGEFSFLDVGGGKGFFADHILSEFPQSSGVVVDISRLLLGQNVPHARKRLLLGSGTELRTLFHEKFDLVFFNFALHHFVGCSYRSTRNMQRASLLDAASILSPRGRIGVAEITYNGLLAHNAPGFIVYHATASKTLEPLVRRFGANTAGCGVCFLSDKAWRSQFSSCGLAIRGAQPEHSAQRRSLQAQCRLALVGAHRVHNVFYWLAPN